uniref:Uncharacterized protein n=1 Tax=viral metagenome TaxID=1070528 RepID=A0A6M3KYP9_9ZZZZ
MGYKEALEWAKENRETIKSRGAELAARAEYMLELCKHDIPEPKGWFNKRCPYCDAPVEKFDNITRRTPLHCFIDCWECTACDYEYFKYSPPSGPVGWG